MIEVVDNVLDLDENVYNESTPFEAPSRILQALETQLTNLHQQAEDLNFTEVRDNIAVRAFTADQNTFLSEITFGTFFNSITRNIQEDLDDSLINVFKDAGPSILDDVKASITLPTSLLDAIQYGKMPHSSGRTLDIEVELVYSVWQWLIGWSPKREAN